MKGIKASLVALALLASIGVYAQEKPVTFGIKGGVNLVNLIGGEEIKPKVGFNVGGTVDIKVISDFYVLTGLEFVSKGAKLKKGKIVNTEVNFNPMYLQVPIHAAYKIKVDDQMKVVLHGGPYLAYGVGGKIKGEIDIPIVGNLNDKINFFSDKTFQNFDFGMGVGVGFEISKFYVDINSDFGLINIVSRKRLMETLGINKVRNMSADLSIGYKF